LKWRRHLTGTECGMESVDLKNFKEVFNTKVLAKILIIKG
jgi:hypothetical protein